MKELKLALEAARINYSNKYKDVTNSKDYKLNLQ